MSEMDIVRKLENLFSSRVKISASCEGNISLQVGKEDLRDVISYLKNEGFMHLVAITVLETNGAFELLYHLGMGGTLLTVRVNLPLNDDGVQTVVDIFPVALVYEREAHELFGVKFEGNPNLDRFILPDDWLEDVYPLKKSGTKDYEKLEEK